MKGINAHIAHWINKYTRGNWQINEKGKIDIEGDVIVTDSQMENLPVLFGSISGKFMLKGCHCLKSLVGFPENAFLIEVEDCLLPTDFYIDAFVEKLTMEEIICKKIDIVTENPEVLSIVSVEFPELLSDKRGLFASKRFGF